MGGESRVADYNRITLLDLKKEAFDGGISEMYLEPTLLQPMSEYKTGIVGKYSFIGHGYSYDWNICYYKKPR